jgi:hypothetical protein
MSLSTKKELSEVKHDNKLDLATAKRLLGANACKYTDLQLQEIISALNAFSVLIATNIKAKK